MNALELLASVHGHLGVLASAALLHPSISLRHGRPLARGMRWSIGLTAAFTVLAFSLGVAIYEDYRELVKRGLFVESRAAGLLFETKEHLAYVVVALTVGGAVCALAAPRDEPRLRQLAAVLFVSAALACLCVVVIGVYVAAVRGFAS